LATGRRHGLARATSGSRRAAKRVGAGHQLLGGPDLGAGARNLGTRLGGVPAGGIGVVAGSDGSLDQISGRGRQVSGPRLRAGEVRARCREAYQKIFDLRQSNVASIDRRADQEIRELKDTIAALQSGRVKAMGGAAGTVDSRVAQLEARIRDLQRMRQMDTGKFESPAEVSLALGSAHFRNGSAADAEREWQAAVAANPKLGEAHNNLAVIYLQTGRIAEAEEAVNLAKKAGFRVNPQLEKDIKARRQH
jgi:tetratricopeptide (TPR) repeat protein